MGDANPQARKARFEWHIGSLALAVRGPVRKAWVPAARARRPHRGVRENAGDIGQAKRRGTPLEDPSQPPC
jgi:hypothetical protein